MNSKFKTTLCLLLLAFTLFNCKKENGPTLSEYKHSDKAHVINCDGADANLVNEALFSFEEDIMGFYGQTRPNISLALAYSMFLRDAINGRAKYAEMLTPHTVEVFKVLQSNKDLWSVGNPASNLNYNSSFFNCISNNIQDESLSKTLHALLITNSMSPKLFGAPLFGKYTLALNDKYLATYMAFDLLYAKLFEVDLTQVKEREPAKVDFNMIPRTNN